jgi:hypothetical protein
MTNREAAVQLDRAMAPAAVAGTWQGGHREERRISRSSGTAPLGDTRRQWPEPGKMAAAAKEKRRNA